VGPPRPGGLAIRGLVTAIRFLTIVPVPGRALEGPDALGRAAGWFPLVGLTLGGLLWVAHRLLSMVFPPLLTALLVLVTWKALTGGIHLDGLADTLDGLTGRDPQERLAIMRDSRIGVFGALGLSVVLLISLLALAELPGPVREKALLLAPVVGRHAPLQLARAFQPATPGQGSGEAFMKAVTLRAVSIGALLVIVSAAVILWPWGLLAAGIGIGLAWDLGRYLSRRLGGLTGDGLGAAVEVGEMGVLLAVAAFSFLRWV
jgi:adenosylcobinamide-GDP ribazoletransferase